MLPPQNQAPTEYRKLPTDRQADSVAESDPEAESARLYQLAPVRLELLAGIRRVCL
jgi:hypothetical protein